LREASQKLSAQNTSSENFSPFYLFYRQLHFLHVHALKFSDVRLKAQRIGTLELQKISDQGLRTQTAANVKASSLVQMVRWHHHGALQRGGLMRFSTQWVFGAQSPTSFSPGRFKLALPLYAILFFCLL
jgi:hypothetical protein